MDPAGDDPRLPIELRLSTAQRVCDALFRASFFLPIVGIQFLPRRTPRAEWFAWFLVVMAALLVVAVVLHVRRRARLVLRLTSESLYQGRDDGKVQAGLGLPIEIRWRDVREVRVVERRWSRQVIVDGFYSGNFLLLPRSTLYNPDPQFDARVALLREVWQAHRHPLPPPPNLPPPPVGSARPTG